MTLSFAQEAFAFLSGALVGFSLSVTGAGGSILAVPLLVYLVGVPDPHVAIGTGAIAVAGNGALALASHARAGNVKWRCALVFAAAGVAGALIGSSIGKAMDGEQLLGLFAVLMMIVAGLMLWRREQEPLPGVRLNRENFPWLATLGFATGALSGFFGIGGGFLVVPALVFATGMPILNAVGSSLVAVTAFGVTTAANYAASGYVDWLLGAVFVLGGLAGGLIGTSLAARLATRNKLFNTVVAFVIFAAAIYTMLQVLLSA